MALRSGGSFAVVEYAVAARTPTNPVGYGVEPTIWTLRHARSVTNTLQSVTRPRHVLTSVVKKSAPAIVPASRSGRSRAAAHPEPPARAALKTSAQLRNTTGPNNREQREIFRAEPGKNSQPANDDGLSPNCQLNLGETAEVFSFPSQHIAGDGSADSGNGYRDCDLTPMNLPESTLCGNGQS
jgi:hypothetical protein